MKGRARLRAVLCRHYVIIPYLIIYVKTFPLTIGRVHPSHNRTGPCPVPHNSPFLPGKNLTNFLGMITYYMGGVYAPHRGVVYWYGQEVRVCYPYDMDRSAGHYPLRASSTPHIVHCHDHMFTSSSLTIRTLGTLYAAQELCQSPQLARTARAMSKGMMPYHARQMARYGHPSPLAEDAAAHII